MTEPNLLKRAREGDPASIAALMNHSLKPKGIQARVSMDGDRLYVGLESQTIPDQSLLTKFVQTGIQNLKSPTIQTVEVSGQQVGSRQPAWSSTFSLSPPSISSPPPPRSPAPPPPPVAPPPVPAPPSRPDSGSTTKIQGTTIQGNETIILGPSPGSPPPPPIPPQAESFQSYDSDAVSPGHGDEVTPAPASVDQGASDWYVDDDLGDDLIYGDEEFDTESDDGGMVATLEPSLDESGALPPAEASPLEDSEVDDQTPQQRRRPREQRRRSPSSSSNPALLAVVTLIVLGVVGSLIGYSLWSYFNSGGSIFDPAITPAPPPPAEDAEAQEEEDTGDEDTAGEMPTLTAAEALQEANEKAESANTLAQTAQSGDDWSLVARQWQRAVLLLEAIPATSTEYNTAQERLGTYRNQLNAANQRASNLSNVSSAPLPSTVITVFNDIDCPTVARTEASPPVELSNVQYAEAEEGSETRQLIGCITNHGDQPLASAAVNYTGTSPDDPETPVTGEGGLSFPTLAPGETIAFRGQFDLPSNLSEVQIQSITWSAAGAAEPQVTETTITVAGS